MLRYLRDIAYGYVFGAQGRLHQKGKEATSAQSSKAAFKVAGPRLGHKTGDGIINHVSRY